MKEYKKLLLSNKAWAAERLELDATYFDNLSKEQNPLFLWIGCADSRVPAEEITHADPGDIFVHRNIANVVTHNDMSLLSVLDYSVNVLKIKHIIVCGHYGCGGVNAAMGLLNHGLVNKWLRNIKEVYSKHADELEAIADNTERSNRFVELNVMEQVRNLCHTSFVQEAWERGQPLTIHGWVYSLRNGRVKDLRVSHSCADKIDDIYTLEQADGHISEK